MKRYYVKYYNNFCNTYNLAWAETTEQIAIAEKNGMERITRKQAEKLCSDENYRRKTDYNFSGFASSIILPIDYNDDWMNDRLMHKNGYIVEANNIR